ncbi:MAG: hypothetical protein EBT13_18455, partial [Rhodobacteraceae bacterium]|nr:hypothetical protein [Paracoccaceae bacterium]
MESLMQAVQGKKVHGIVALFIACVLAEKGLGWDIPGFDAPADWLNQVLVALGISAGRSTIGQIMFFSDHGRFYDGDIHDATEGIHKWVLEPSQPVIRATIEARRAFTFSAVRNPYARVLSAFLDKICG